MSRKPLDPYVKLRSTCGRRLIAMHPVTWLELGKPETADEAEQLYARACIDRIYGHRETLA